MLNAVHPDVFFEFTGYKNYSVSPIYWCVRLNNSYILWTMKMRLWKSIEYLWFGTLFQKNGRYMDYNSTSFVIAGDVGNQLMWPFVKTNFWIMLQMLSLYFTDSTSSVDVGDVPCSSIVIFHYLQPFWTQQNGGCSL